METQEELMTNLLLASACALAISATGVMAQSSTKQDRATTGQAGGYTYCLKTSVGSGDCKYKTLQQCQAAMSGTNGDCVKNIGSR